MPTTTTEEIRIGELAIRLLLEGDESAGSAALFEFTVPSRARVPVAHSHDAYEETVYGLEGTLTWTVEGDRHEVGPGRCSVSVAERSTGSRTRATSTRGCSPWSRRASSDRTTSGRSPPSSKRPQLRAARRTLPASAR